MLIIASGRLVAHAPVRSLVSQATQMVRVRTPQAEELREVLMARGHTAEVREPDIVVVVGATTEEVGLAAAGRGIVIYEMTAERASLEETFFQLTSGMKGGAR